MGEISDNRGAEIGKMENNEQSTTYLKQQVIYVIFQTDSFQN